MKNKNLKKHFTTILAAIPLATASSLILGQTQEEKVEEFNNQWGRFSC
jgi:hypothetical protein